MKEIKDRLNQYHSELEEIRSKKFNNDLSKKELKVIKEINNELEIRISELMWVYKLLSSDLTVR